ncbi:hypothetical protein HPB51_009872 [Rhipicephalus microplus]|uniref:Uncharacterized protein n=1 Tax=Rhipicephalus microplus TaxID=6941 RepID=A0A9J6ET12_RHIMP|nr:hypothetical protein HPB51_009872 [Rhipicephalus microplus]
MDLEGPGDLPTGPAPDMESHDGGQERKGPAASYATASGTTPLPAPPHKSSVGDGYRPGSSGRALSKYTRSTPTRASASPLTSTSQLGHRQKQVLRTRDVEKASRLERKPPECLASWDPSFSRSRQVNSKSPTCVDAAPSTILGGGDEVKSITLLLDASSSSASAEAAMTSTPIADETSETRTLPTEPLIKRQSLEEPARKKSSGVSTRRSSRGRPALKTSKSKLSGDLGVTCGRDGGERLDESSTVTSEDDERPKTSLLQGVMSSLGTFLGKIIGRPLYERVPKPEASSPEDATAIGESNRKRKPHSYVSRQTGRGIGVVNKICPLTAERLPIQTAMQRSCKTPQNVAADPVNAHEGRTRRSQAVSECAEMKSEKAKQVQGSVPLDNTATEFSFTGFPFADGRGDVQRQRRQQSLPPACGVQGSKAAIPLCHTVTVVTTVHESPDKRGHGKKKSKESKQHRDHRRDDGDARAGKSKSSSKRHNHERSRRGDRKRSSRASSGRKRKRKDKAEDNADIFDDPDGSTYEVGSPMASREFSFEIAMVPFTRGALPRPELTRPSKHRFNSDQWRESTTSRSVEAVSPASPVSPGSPPSPLSPASQGRRASPADGADTSPLINQETRSERKAHPRMDENGSETPSKTRAWLIATTRRPPFIPNCPPAIYPT